MERNMMRIGAKNMPKSPTTSEGIEKVFLLENVMQHFGTAKNAEDKTFFKIVFKCDAFEYCVFASDRIIELIEKYFPDIAERRYLMEATFKIVPVGPYKQFLILYVELIDKVILI